MIKKMLAVIVGASLVFSVGNLWAADTTKENTSLPNLMIKKEQETSRIPQHIIVVVLMLSSLVSDFASVSMDSVVMNIPFAFAAAELNHD